LTTKYTPSCIPEQHYMAQYSIDNLTLEFLPLLAPALIWGIASLQGR